MQKKERGADTGKCTTPKGYLDFNRINNVCLVLFFVGAIVTMIGKFKEMECCLWLGIGMCFTATMVILEIMNIEEDEENDKD